MMEFEGIHHVSIVVRDLARAKAFYGEILGLKEMKRPDFDFPGAWYQVGEAQQLHLIVHPPSQTVRESTSIDTRDGHFAIRVKDYQMARDHLLSHGLEIIERPNSITGFAQIYCCDPDGNVIEFNAQ